MSRAILPQVPVRIAKAEAISDSRSLWPMPWCVRRRQIEQGRQPLGHREATFAERSQRTGGAAELQRQRLPAQPAQPLAGARQRSRVTRELQSERHRQGMLQQACARPLPCGAGGRRLP